MKLDSNRNIEWQQCYGGSGDEGVTGLIEVSDGYVFLAYASEGDGDLTGSGWHGGNDIWMVRTDFSGNIIWQKCFGGSSDEFANRVFSTADGGFVVAGMTKSVDGDVAGNHSINDCYDIWLFKVSGAGNLVWQKCFGGTSDEMIDFGVVKKSDNQYILAGVANFLSDDVTCTHNTVYNDFWVFQVTDTLAAVSEKNPAGNMMKVYPNPADDFVVFDRADLPAGAVWPEYLEITDLLGEKVTVLRLNGKQTLWHTQKTRPGIYFYHSANGLFSGKQ